MLCQLSNIIPSNFKPSLPSKGVGIKASLGEEVLITSWKEKVK